MMKIMTIRLPDEIQEELKKRADALGIPRNALVSIILRNWLEETTKTI